MIPCLDTFKTKKSEFYLYLNGKVRLRVAEGSREELKIDKKELISWKTKDNERSLKHQTQILISATHKAKNFPEITRTNF